MSPVHDQSYRRYAGTRRAPGRAWRVIAAHGLRVLVRRKVVIAVLAVAWIPFLVRTVQFYVVTMYPQAREVLPVDARMFRSFVEGQGAFAFFMTLLAGAGLIADDRRANALQVYLSKPLMRFEYVWGKLVILMSAVAAVTVVPSLLLLPMQMAMTGSAAFVREQPSVIAAVLLSTLIRVIVASLTMLALSALSRSARYATVMYAGVIFFTEAMYGVLTFVSGSTRLAWVSVSGNIAVVNDAIFRQPARYETPLPVSLLVLTGLLVLSVSILERSVRGVEVVS